MSEPSTTVVLQLLAGVVAKHGEDVGTKSLACFQRIFKILESQEPEVRDGTLEIFVRAIELAKKD